MTFPSQQVLTRRSFTAGLAAAGLGVSGHKISAGGQTAVASLGALAAEKGILFGASFAVHELDDPQDARYGEIYEHDARILTSELEFKMSSLRPAANALDFSGADRLVAFARARQMKVRGHTLIWNDNLPDWIKALSKADAEQLLETHITSVVERYRDRVGIWDVVNEPIGPWDRLPGNLRGGPFYAALGEGYIAKAFTTARALAPSATLVLNEAQTETADANGATFRSSLLALLQRLKDQGAPIDAVGLQSHLRTAATYDFAAFTGWVREIASLGCAIHLTELDVNDTGVPGSTNARDAAVADLYERYLTAMLQIPAVTVVELWQLADGASWMQDPVTAAKLGIRANPRPLIYDRAYNKKPSWEAIARAFRAAPAR